MNLLRNQIRDLQNQNWQLSLEIKGLALEIEEIKKTLNGMVGD
jgi:chaperonin cofactor prefoldin